MMEIEDFDRCREPRARALIPFGVFLVFYLGISLWAGDFYRVPADNRGLNYDKYFKEGDDKRNPLTEFNSNNPRRLNLQETMDTIASLSYIQQRLAEK